MEIDLLTICRQTEKPNPETLDLKDKVNFKLTKQKV